MNIKNIHLKGGARGARFIILELIRRCVYTVAFQEVLCLSIDKSHDRDLGGQISSKINKTINKK